MAELKALFGAMMRRHRTRLGVSQIELAQRTGRSLETIARVERGENAPSFETAELIATALGIPVGALFGVEQSPDLASPLGELMIKLAVLNDENLAWLDRLLTLALEKPN